jgi:hypothetical protein
MEARDGRHNNMKHTIAHGSYRYITDTALVNRNLVYTMTGKRQAQKREPQILSEVQVIRRPVHTRGTQHTGGEYIRKAAVRHEGKLATAWDSNSHRLEKIQLYAGGTIIMAKSSTFDNDETWLSADEYDETTRVAIDGLCGMKRRKFSTGMPWAPGRCHQGIRQK